MTRQETNMRQTIPVEKRVAIRLLRLAKGDSFNSISLSMGVGESTVVGICRDFENAVVALKDRYVVFPKTELETAIEMDAFEEKYGIPQILGVIDGSHIKIRAPFDCPEDYFDRKKDHSITLQGIVNSSLEFIHASVGYPGSIHDARVMRLSGLFDDAENERILTGPSRVLNGNAVRPLIAADSAYPASNWLIKPFPSTAAMPRDHKRFNKKFSGMRVIVERAFGILKGRWRILNETNYQTIDKIPNVTMACVILHNFCIQEKDELDEDFSRYEEPDNDNRDGDHEANARYGAVDVREAVFSHLSENGSL